MIICITVMSIVTFPFSFLIILIWALTFMFCFMSLTKGLLLFSCSVMSNSLETHGLLHPRLPCPSLSPEVCSNSCPLSRWCHPTISSSVTSFSSCSQFFPASGSFPMSRLFPSGDQSIGASALVLLMNIQDWFPLGLTGLISCSPRDSQESSPTPQFGSINSSASNLLYGQTLPFGFFLFFSFLSFSSPLLSMCAHFS